MNILVKHPLGRLETGLMKGNATMSFMFPFTNSLRQRLIYKSLLLQHPNLQYIPRNMHTVLLCFALLWLCNRS